MRLTNCDQLGAELVDSALRHLSAEVLGLPGAGRGGSQDPDFSHRPAASASAATAAADSSGVSGRNRR